jgi:TPR repeat protein
MKKAATLAEARRRRLKARNLLRELEELVENLIKRVLEILHALDMKMAMPRGVVIEMAKKVITGGGPRENAPKNGGVNGHQRVETKDMLSLYETALKIASRKPNKKEGKKALALLDQGVLEGDERAIYARAICYSDGTCGSRVSETKATSLFLKLTNSSIPEALFVVAGSYDCGLGVEEDQFTAFEYYLKAATLGHSEACFQVSEFFREGTVVPVSRNLQDFWFKRSKKSEPEISSADRIWLK